MTIRSILFAAALAVVAIPVAAETPDYSELSEGDDINGVPLGNIIISSPNDVTYIVEDVTNTTSFVAYGAPNGTLSKRNGCLPAEGGFSDLDVVGSSTAPTDHNYTFDFLNDAGDPATTDSFSITMYDFGDYNPVNLTYHKVVVSAYDAADVLLASDTLELNTTSAVNPRGGSYSGPPDDFDPFFEGDACDAAGDPPLGTYTFTVEADDIAYVILDVETNSDPNIGFGDIKFTCPSSEVEFEFCAGQSEDIGSVYVSNDDENLYVTFTIDFINWPGWYLDETHVAVGKTVDDIPQTRKKNPIPGQFAYDCGDLDPAQTTCTVQIDLDDLGDCCAGDEIVVAAHASVVEVAGDGCAAEETTFWAINAVDDDQGTLKNGDPVLLARSDPANALGAPDWTGGPPTFFSLGFDLDPAEPVLGWLTVDFGLPIYNGPGDDIVVSESTGGRYPLETADVFGVRNGSDYYAGEVDNTGADSAGLPDGMAMFDAVKLLNTSDPAPFEPTADGFDVDAVAACYLVVGDETAWGDGCEGERFTKKGNWGTYINYTLDECAECVE